jgi:hypothetical protein
MAVQATGNQPVLDAQWFEEWKQIDLQSIDEQTTYRPIYKAKEQTIIKSKRQQKRHKATKRKQVRFFFNYHTFILLKLLYIFRQKQRGKRSHAAHMASQFTNTQRKRVRIFTFNFIW